MASDLIINLPKEKLIVSQVCVKENRAQILLPTYISLCILYYGYRHRLNMELDRQSLFGLNVYTAELIG